MATARAILAIVAPVVPANLLPSHRNAGFVLRCAIALPTAVICVAEGIGAVHIRVFCGHVHEAGIVGANGAGLVH